jgi:hypothetical protein
MIPMQNHQIPEVGWFIFFEAGHLILKSFGFLQELVLFGLRTKLGIPRSRFITMTGGSQLEDVCV